MTWVSQRPKRAGLERLLALFARGVDGQAHHETDNLFVSHQLLEKLRVQRLVAARVVLMRAGKLASRVRDRDPNAHGAVVDCRQAAGVGEGKRCIHKSICM